MKTRPLIVSLLAALSVYIPLSRIAGGTAGNLPVSDGTKLVSRTLSGDATLGSTGTLTLSTVITGASAGNSTTIPAITYDSKGRLTSVTATAIAGLGASVISSGTIDTARLGSGTANSSTYLRGDQTWATISAGSGTVTSVGLTVPSWLSVAGSPVTTSGTLAVSANSQAANSALMGPTSGGSATPSFRSLVAGDIPSLDAAKIATGTLATARLGSGSADASNFLRGDQTWSNTLTGASSATVLSLAGTSANPAIDISNTTNQLAWLTSSSALGSSSGAAFGLFANAAPTAANQRVGAINFGTNLSGTATSNAFLQVFSEEPWATNRGTFLRLSLGTTGASTATTRMEWRGNGDVITNASGSALSTSATGGFTWLPSMAGPPSGTPANSYTGAVPMVVDTTNSRIYGRIGSTWTNLSSTTGNGLSVVFQSSNASYTMTTEDALVKLATLGTPAITLPDAASNSGKVKYIKNASGSVSITVGRAGTDQINGGTTAVTLAAGTAGQFLSVDKGSGQFSWEKVN